MKIKFNFSEDSFSKVFKSHFAGIKLNFWGLVACDVRLNNQEGRRLLKLKLNKKNTRCKRLLIERKIEIICLS